MNVNGYEIDIKNATFKQEIQLVIKCKRPKRENEILEHDIYFDNLSLKTSNEELEISNVPHRAIEYRGYWGCEDKRIDVRYDEVANCVVFILLNLKHVKYVDSPTQIPYIEMKRFYITPNKNLIYNKKQKDYYYEEDEITEALENPEWVFVENPLKMGDYPFNIQDYDFLNETSADNSSDIIAKHLLETMGKIFNKSVIVAGNKSLTLNNKYSIMEFLLYKEPQGRKGPQQQKINDLCAIPIKPFVPAKIEQKGEFIQEGRLVKLTEEMSCFQMFRVNKNREEFYETFRIFIDSDGNIFSCKKNNFNKFIPTKFSMEGRHWQAIIRDEEYDPEATKNNKLSYYKDIIMDIPCEGRGYAIWCFLTNDLFEKFYKAGLKNYLNYMFLFSPDFPTNEIKIAFDNAKPLEDKVPVIQMLGLNKYQLTKFMDLYATLSPFEAIRGYGSRYVYKFKQIFNTRDISHIDDKTFDFLFDYFFNNPDKFEKSKIVDVIDDAALFTNTYDINALLNYINILDIVYDCSYWDRNYYKDFLKMVKDMEYQSIYKPKVKNMEELRLLHDNINALYYLKKNEIKISKFRERVPYWEKFEFSDEQFAIVAPQYPEDMITEGNKLHHCVKSYIDRVSDGLTNVLFLRKKEELNEPFFTIELSNDNKIEQVHGNCNRNMSTEPGISEFVNKWAEKKKLIINGCNKVR